MRFDDLSVKFKLWAIVLGLMASLVVLGTAVMVHVESVTKESNRVVAFGNERVVTALRWKSMVQSSVDGLLAAMQVSDAEVSARILGRAQKFSDAVTALQKEVEEQAFWPENRAQLERIAAQRAEVLKVAATMQQLRSQGDMQGVWQAADTQFNPAVAKYMGELDQYVQLQVGRRDQAVQDAQDSRHRAYGLGAGLTLAIVLLGFVAAWLAVRSILAPLARAVGLADVIAAGDLTQDVHDGRKDELGQLLRSLSTMGTRLRSLVADVRTGVESVSSAAGEIAVGNNDLSARTEQTAANLEETAASMEELTATVTQSADTARQASQLAADAMHSARKGGQVVDQVIASMEQITQSSSKIGEIISVIDSIAFQTNILALNAAVEAARAGEQGRGFAVVASEVRALAARSASAAKEINTLITTSVQNVKTGSTQVSEAGESMREIVQSVQRMNDLIGEITASASEQRDGISQVNQAVTNLDQMTQQNAALVEEASAAAASMNEQAQHLAKAVAIFQVGSQGASVPRARPGRPPAASAPAPARSPSVNTPLVSPRIPRSAAPAKAAKLGASARGSAPGGAGGEGDWESF